MENTWFNEYFGFDETRENIYKYISVESESDNPQNIILYNAATDKKYPVGCFSTPTLKELRKRAAGCGRGSGHITVKHEIITDIFKMHAANPDALFQVASQFNCLEMSHPEAIPEDGITEYEYDYTQGPACVLAAAAGTLYRNYFVPLVKKTGEIQIGQTEHTQINNLINIEHILKDKTNRRFWTVKNGYINSTVEKLQQLNTFIQNSSSTSQLRLEHSLRIGLQTQVGVDFTERFVATAAQPPPRVSQAFCSAISCGYARNIPIDLWEPLARIILRATYEATIYAAICGGHKKVFLTFVGGGAFRNKQEWIARGIGSTIGFFESCNHYDHYDLEIIICHHMQYNTDMMTMIDCFREHTIQKHKEYDEEYDELMH